MTGGVVSLMLRVLRASLRPVSFPVRCSVAAKVTYQAKYENSWALVIGINKYKKCSPLDYAGNDATAVATALTGKFGFPEENVEILQDKEATKAAILSAMLRHAVGGPDDRGLIFFAGHGHTSVGRRGEVGFLVPYDGDCDNMASLIRWDELTRNSDLLPAKHVLFIMDACYDGLAVTRHLHPGSTRFLKDMLGRHARQVLTAGKADEEVADGDGPRAGNSLFTGHLLDALDGAAATKDGYLTANGVMAYVYDRVAKDQHSQQTPHYGFIDGDGDFIFSAFPPDLLANDAKGGKDVLVGVPATLIDQEETTAEEDRTERLKEYLSEPKYRIKLDDLVTSGVRRAILASGDKKFPLQSARPSVEDVASRVRAYEEVIRPIQGMTVLLGKWANAEQRPVLENMFARLSDSNTGLASGMVVWIGMRWYPISFLLYVGGIAALSSGNYANLASMHMTQVEAQQRSDRGAVELIVPVVDGLLDLERSNAWKLLPGYERNYAPHSEYMFKAVQPVLEDVLFLGASYEQLFDRYEIFRALLYADIEDARWGPVGRFGWKYTGRMRQSNPYSELRAEAALRKDSWPPLRVGLFRGSYARFEEVAKNFETNVLNRLQWF
jgi:hypothetical protein